ncbi:hypothetical protein ACOJAM_08845 [Corynebacterium striatum]|uniref:hypothetical protein n=1 Tax=Corynebacterium striatum TaxID=43770 RepID=UPI003AC8ADFA
MKRLPQTLTAAVLTGALAFGGAAVAQAQIPAPVEQAQIPAPVEQAQIPAPVEQAQIPAPVEDAPITDMTGDPNAQGIPDPEGIPAPATKEDSKGNTWYQSMKDPSVYVNDPALVNVEVTPEMRDAYAKAFPSETPSDPQKPGFDAKKLAWLALPAALIIGGITWYLSQDGKTYVKDEARKNQQPTAEEKAASEQMLNANKNEVIAQGGKLAEGAAPAAARGMSAETGSNSVAQALAALAVAAMVAAGAFAARRKFFA